MRLTKFIILNILMSLLECVTILVISYNISQTLFYVMIFIYIALFTYQLIKTNKRNIFEEVEVENNLFDTYIDLINKTKEIKPDLQAKYIKLNELPNPAFYYKNTVYINTNAKIEPDFFEGMLAHELGHATTSLGDVVNLVVLRLSTLLANLLYMFRFQLKDRNTIPFKILDTLYYLIYLLISIPDILVLNNFIKEDEFLANDYAVKITDGRSLRAYYYKAYKLSDQQKVKYDLKHPSVLEMINRMESQMNLSTYEKNVYAVKKRIYYIKGATSQKERQTASHNYYLHCLPLDKDTAFKLALNYERGIGTVKDILKTKEYLKIATDFNHNKAPYKLANIYKQEKNIIEAEKYFLVASKNNPVSFYHLGNLYVDTDIEKAKEYYYKGAEHNNKESIRKLEQILLTNDDLEKT